MAVSVVCPECDHRFSVRDEAIGRKGKCPSCGGVFRAEAADLEPSLNLSGLSVSTQGPRPAIKKSNGAAPKSNGAAAGGMFDVTADRGVSPVAPAAAAPAAKSKSKSAAPSEDASPGGMPLAGWITIAVLGIAATVGAVLLYTSKATAAKDEMAATVAKLDDGKKAEEARKELLTKVDTLEGDVKRLKELLDATESGTRLREKVQANAFEESLVPGCVKIQVYGPDKKTVISTGSGFFIDDKRHVVTTHDVLAGASKVGIILSSGFEFDIEGMVAADPKLNLAVLKPQKSDLPATKFLKLAAAAPKVPGDTLYSLGNPGNQRFTVTRGIVTRVIDSKRLADEKQMFYGEFKPGDATFTYIEHDARMFPGDFGGALLNENLEVIGVNLALATMIMNDRMTVVPTLGGGCTVDSVKPLVASIGTAIMPYPAAKEKPKKPEGEKKEDEKKEEEKEDEKKEGEDGEAMPEGGDMEEGGMEEGGEGDALAAEIDAAYEKCDGFEWKPTDEEEYGHLAALGKAIRNAKKATEEGSPNEKVAAAILKVKTKLTELDWKGELTAAVNKKAAELEPKEDEGVYFLGTALGAVKGQDKMWVVKIEGTNEHALVQGIEDDIAQGKKLVVAGVFVESKKTTLGSGAQKIEAIRVDAGLTALIDK